MNTTLNSELLFLIVLLILIIIGFAFLAIFRRKRFLMLDHDGGDVHDPPLTIVTVNSSLERYQSGVDYYFGVVENKGGFFSSGPKFNFYVEKEKPEKGTKYSWHGRQKIKIRKPGSDIDWNLFVVKNFKKIPKT